MNNENSLKLLVNNLQTSVNNISQSFFNIQKIYQNSNNNLNNNNDDNYIEEKIKKLENINYDNIIDEKIKKLENNNLIEEKIKKLENNNYDNIIDEKIKNNNNIIDEKIKKIGNNNYDNIIDEKINNNNNIIDEKINFFDIIIDEKIKKMINNNNNNNNNNVDNDLIINNNLYINEKLEEFNNRLDNIQYNSGNNLRQDEIYKIRDIIHSQESTYKCINEDIKQIKNDYNLLRNKQIDYFEEVDYILKSLQNQNIEFKKKYEILKSLNDDNDLTFMSKDDFNNSYSILNSSFNNSKIEIDILKEDNDKIKKSMRLILDKINKK